MVNLIVAILYFYKVKVYSNLKK